MSVTTLLNELFPLGHKVTLDDYEIHGTASTEYGEVAILGTINGAAIDHAITLNLAARILDVHENWPGRPILLWVDTQGQKLSRHEELLCLNGSLAHLAECVEFARQQGHIVLSMVMGEAVSGGFLSFGLMGDSIYALRNAQVRVMDLRAMARVTKIDYEHLVELAQSSAIFAPGVENYWKMGALQALWDAPLATSLNQALKQAFEQAHDGVIPGDVRQALGVLRQGREYSQPITQRVIDAV